MKKNPDLNFGLMTALLSTLTLSAALPTYSLAGANTGGGGNSIAAHFADAGKRTGALFHRLCASADPSETELCSFKSNYLQAIALAKVVPSQSPVLGPDGKPREANNDGINTINVDINAWKALVQSPANNERAVRLVMHEYAQLAKMESSDSYVRSGAIMQAFKSGMIDLSAVLGKAPVLPKSQPCGLQGSIAERVADCGTTDQGWSLVTRTSSLSEYWLNPDGSAIWSPILFSTSAVSASVACANWAPQLLFSSESWHLPNQDEFKRAPGLSAGQYWPDGPTWGKFPFGEQKAWLANVSATGVKFTEEVQAVDHSVRCVLRLR